MLKSKEIADFVPADLRRLHPGQPIPADLYLYFKSNSHIMLWQPAGTVFKAEVLEKYSKRGLQQIWVHKSEWETFSRYLNNVAELIEMPRRTKAVYEFEGSSPWEKPGKRPPPLPSELIYTTKVSARDIETIIMNPEKSERERRGLVARASRTLLGELASPANLEEQDIVRRAVSKVIEDLLNPAASPEDGEAAQTRKTCQQIWKIAGKVLEFCHGVNVSTTAVLFALAFGRIEQDLLADIALAALIHDIGMTLFPYQLSQIPRESLTGDELIRYLGHADAIPRLISDFAPEIPDRAMLLARHHHEHYSPDTLSPLSELSQLIAMADVLDSICSGQWDGQERTFAEGLKRLEEMEDALRRDNRERLFSPSIFAAVLRWIRGAIPEDLLLATTTVVSEQIRSVQGRG